jgi:hypothetical protein
MKKITKGIIAVLGAINYIFKLFLPILFMYTMIEVFKIIGFQKYLLLTIGFLAVIYEVIKVAGLEVLASILKNALNKNE